MSTRWFVIAGGAATLVLAALRVSELSSQAQPPAEENSLGMRFVQLKKGKFWMGGYADKPGDKEVEIKADFQMGVTEVTQGQWKAVMSDNPSSFSRKGDRKDEVKDFSDAELLQFPVESVSWYRVQEYIKKLNARERNGGWVYRLPTEAEWEYACRGGATSKEDCSFDFYLNRSLNSLSSRQANFDGSYPFGGAVKGPKLGRPTKVCLYIPNCLGLYDMHGNVSEWCEDLFYKDGTRVIRGGGWGNGGESCPARSRYPRPPSLRKSDLGFRLARVPSER